MRYTHERLNPVLGDLSAPEVFPPEVLGGKRRGLLFLLSDIVVARRCVAALFYLFVVGETGECGVVPEVFKVVVLAWFGQEYVYHHSAVV